MTTIFFEADVSRLYATIMDPLAPQAFPINVGPMASFLFFFFFPLQSSFFSLAWLLSYMTTEMLSQ